MRKSGRVPNFFGLGGIGQRQRRWNGFGGRLIRSGQNGRDSRGTLGLVGGGGFWGDCRLRCSLPAESGAQRAKAFAGHFGKKYSTRSTQAGFFTTKGTKGICVQHIYNETKCNDFWMIAVIRPRRRSVRHYRRISAYSLLEAKTGKGGQSLPNRQRFNIPGGLSPEWGFQA